MAQKPIHESLATRDVIWKQIRSLGRFTISCLEDKIRKLPRRTISSYTECLEKAGIIKKDGIAESNGKKCSEYILVNDSGIEAPRVNKKGEIIPETDQTRMWKAMRVLKTFSIQEIIATASTPERFIAATSADTYLKYLRYAGYLRKKPQDKVYQFNPTMNTGAKAPMLQKINQVYDANLRKVVWSDQGVADESN